MKKGNRYTEEQIVKILHEIQAGKSITEVSRTHAVSIQTLYRWREKYAGMSKSELAELKNLQAENRRLRSVVANQALDIEALKELQKVKW